MVTAPAVTPVTEPEDEPTVAIAMLLLLHVPPTVASSNVMLEPGHTWVGPVIAAGVALTVKGWLALQPVGMVYIILSVPALTPETTPVVEPTVANDVFVLLHVPPVSVLASVIAEPTHTWLGPVIAGGVVLTVTTDVMKHPVPSVYVITGVPAAMPVTTPELFTLPSAMLLLLQVPPPGVDPNTVVEPVHTVSVPVIGVGIGLTVIGLDTEHPVGNVYTMESVPFATPVTTPVVEPTVANEVLVLLHVPPRDVELKVIVAPTHTVDRPAMAAGNGLTVTMADVIQPVDNV